MRLAPGWRRRNAVALVLAVISAMSLGFIQARQAGALDAGGLSFEVLDSLVQDFALRSRTPESYLQASAGQLRSLPDPRGLCWRPSAQDHPLTRPPLVRMAT